MAKTIGVIGGGQLARMMIAPALELGLQIKVLAETEDSPAALAAIMVGDYKDLATVLEFAKEVDVVTFDHEHVPIKVLEELESQGFIVEPSSKALQYAQNKLLMRKRLAELGVPIPDWAEVTSAEELDSFISGHSGVAILKTPTGGYDGKGVRVVRSADDAKDWLAQGVPLLVEEKVEFVRELAQLSARNRSGDWISWPVVQTVQVDGVCNEVQSPAPHADYVKAAEIARTIAQGLDVTGVLAVELFEKEDGTLLVNELAMRPHNSGHFTIEGTTTSQFEQHLRAVSDLPLGSVSATANFAVMLNLLGQNDSNNFVDLLPDTLNSESGSHVHIYGKSARTGRKMGHVTALSNESLESARTQAQASWNGLQA